MKLMASGFLQEDWKIGKFKFKKHEESGVLMITSQQLNWLIEGLEFENKINEDTLSNCSYSQYTGILTFSFV